MSLAKRKQAEIKARIANGETVTVPAPDYNKVRQQQAPATLAAKMRQKKLAEVAAMKQRDDDIGPHTEYNRTFDIIKAALQNDLIRLKDIANVDDKIAYKAKQVGEYLPYLQEYEAEGINHPNVILATMVIWLFDIEDFEQATHYAKLALDQGQRTPKQFKSNLETHICDTLQDIAERKLKNGENAPELDFAVTGLQEQNWTVNDIAAGKVFVMAGKHAEAQGDTDRAIDLYTQAQERNDKAGVKGRLTKLLKAQAGSQ